MRLPRPHLSAVLRPRLPRTRAGQRRTVQALMLLCVLALIPATWVFTAADDRLRTTTEAPRTDVAVVFGAGLLWNGEPSIFLANRLDAAAELYREGRVKVVLVTGDNSSHHYNEPHTMRHYLIDRGVPHAHIVSDYAGFDTWDSCVRAKKIFGVDRAILVSQGFHIRRAVALCQGAGVDSYGVSAADHHDAIYYYGATRELFAASKAALDAAFEPDPQFLGPKEPGVARALADAR
ncbi:ElyC/SanA/YdcF family protein [Streptomyces prasinosporus]|uniref:ElyC/SanA/YdcF family protein n=2 Tax=Streptomyces TaxID=1883 RepID=A0ABP6U0K9_9ACTN|nr:MULTISPECIES: ElyC/SanA/YdcF family protein [Streptomyces]MCG0062183.1 YdcF family protein [Streptomyces tricolor]GHC14057.1 membrane protein [Streptomyces albogriseolus]